MNKSKIINIYNKSNLIENFKQIITIKSFHMISTYKSVDITPNYSVVMTACIDPRNGSTGEIVNRSNPKIRLKDYEDGLKFWLGIKEPRITKIIFIDNSGYTLDSLQEIYKKNNVWEKECEFISLNCNEIPPGLHYGFAEFKLLHLGLQKSLLLEGSDYLIKVTGRYQFPTISQLLNCLPQRYKVAADTRNVSLFVPYPRRNVMVGLIIFTVEFYCKYIQEVYQEMQSTPRKSFVEDILYDKLMPMRDDPEVILRWPCNCEPQGIGGNGDSYTSFRKKFLAVSRSVGRVMFPYWWF
ncbi:MAG: hypothetical protein DSM106950_17790 [Stigonema ocellatum SAG 48.90 = DSM 106950]|nr:hypothetical protein [Stigonema ocellatum SAG 48.90 = DSM 106950]